MKLRARTISRLLLTAAALFVMAGLLLPQLDAGRFRHRIQAALEQALGRRVELGPVHLDVFGGPGFSADRVIIYDDPAISLEPFAYVESLEARVSFASFWLGRLEFGSLRLVNPSVNLARPAGGQWNFVPLLGRTAGAARGGAARTLPEIEVRGGRINFKLGDTKSIFYMLDASLDASPPQSPGGAWRLRFQGSPARTDRAARGFAAFSVRGSWKPGAGTGGDVDLDVELSRSSLAELIQLVHGHDIGMHGQLTTRAHLSGPVSAIGVAGRVEIGELHRWDMLPPYGGWWGFKYNGRLDLPGQQLEIGTLADEASVPVVLNARASEFLVRPRWSLLARLDGLPIGTIADLARRMGTELPADFSAEGGLEGVLAYTPGAGLNGRLLAQQASMAAPGTADIRLTGAELIVAGHAVRLLPSAASLGPLGEARIEARYSWQPAAIEVAVGSSAAGATETAAVAAPLAGDVPVLANCSKAAWKGQLRYRRQADAPPEWSGSFRLENAEMKLPGFADPVEIAHAQVTLRPDGAEIQRMLGRIGEAEFFGEYRYRAGAPRPHQLRLAIAALDAAELERLLAPALHRYEGFLSRALRLGRTRVPDWLAARHADAAIEVGAFNLHGLEVGNLRARVLWDGATVDISDLTTRFSAGKLAGSMAVNLRGPAPVYRMKGRFHDLEWSGGQWDGTGVLETAGTADDLLRNLRVDVAFAGRSVEVGPDAFKRLSGRCAFSIARGTPRLRFSQLEAALGEELFQGKGATGEDGRLHIEFSNGDREMRMVGTVSPLRLEAVAARP